MNLCMPLRDDVHWRNVDSKYNEQLASQSRVDVVKGDSLGNIINPGSRGRGLGIS